MFRGSKRREQAAQPEKDTIKQPAKITYSTKELLGAGSSGSVAKVDLAYTKGTYKKKDAQGNEIDVAVPTWVDKTIDNNQWVLKTVRDFQEEEPAILARYQPTFRPFYIKETDSFNWITRLLPGVTLDNLVVLDFPQALDLINNIALTLNLHHHNTPSTGPAVVHGDLKELNILVKGKEVNFTDYGFSFDIEDDPNLKVERSLKKVNEKYFAPEAVRGFWGIKTDIYMVADVFKWILSQTPFPKTNPDVTVFVDHFIARMRDEDYDKRPDSDETLKFFHTLNLFYKASRSKKPNADLQYEYAAKLALITHNQWNNKIGERIIKGYVAGNVVIEIEKQTWQNFDFAKPNFSFSKRPVMSRLIVELATEDSKALKLTTKKFKGMVTGINRIAIEILDHHKLLNEKVIKALLDNKELRDEIIKDNSNQFRLMSTILSSLANAMTKPQLEIVLKQISMFVTPDLTFLSTLQGSVKECRERALFIINYLVNNAKSSADLDVIKSQLIDLAHDGKIDYLYKRQGSFTFSILNHKWNNEKVSGTWVSLMKSIDNAQRKKDKAAFASQGPIQRRNP